MNEADATQAAPTPWPVIGLVSLNEIVTARAEEVITAEEANAAAKQLLRQAGLLAEQQEVTA